MSTPSPIEFRKDSYSISTDPAKLDVDAIHHWLANESYWAGNIPREVVDRAVANSLCFGLYDAGKFIGLARVITDYATFAYLCDVFILQSHRGRGLSKWMVECILSHPGLQGLRRFNLVTRDAHALYSAFGFKAPANPNSYMELRNANPSGKPAVGI